MNRFIFFIIIPIMVLFSCRRDPVPKGAIKKDKFIAVLVDVHIAEGMVEDAQRIGLDSMKSSRLYLSVLKKHNITEEQMMKTTLYYSRNQKEYDKIFNEVLSKLSALNEEGNTTQNPIEKVE